MKRVRFIINGRPLASVPGLRPGLHERAKVGARCPGHGQECSCQPCRPGRSPGINSTPRPPAPGFTLAEILVAVVLVALGFVAIVAALGHDTVTSQAGEDVMLATYLADEIRDKALQMTFANVLNLDAVTYDPAILSTGSTQDLTNWSQKITVAPVSVSNLNQVVARSGATAARLTVEVRSRGKPVVTQAYYLLDRSGVPFTDR
jgi:type II secretory pathway pseudopilin PulG